MKLTGREVIYANLAGEGPRPGLTFDRGRRNDSVQADPGQPEGYEPKRWIEGNYEYYDDLWGNLWHRMKDGCRGGEVCREAIPDWSALAEFRVPRFDPERTAAHYRAGFEREPEKFRIASLPGWIFAQARYIRRLDNYLMDMLLHPDELKRLHERMAAMYETVIRAAGEAGADAIFFCEDMGTQTDILFSPELWDEFFRELYTRLFALAHENGMQVFMHSCGQNSKILERLLRAGVNAFQFDQPTVYDWDGFLIPLLKQYRAALWAPVDIQKIMPTGDRAVIEQGAEAMVRAFRGRLIGKNYGDLAGIGVAEEWDDWAYEKILEFTV